LFTTKAIKMIKRIALKSILRCSICTRYHSSAKSTTENKISMNKILIANRGEVSTTLGLMLKANYF